MNRSQKVAVVTGTSQHIGSKVEEAFGKRDYRIVVASRLIKPSEYENLLSIVGDIGDPATARHVISEGVARFGRIYTLMNNAGIYIGKPFAHLEPDDFRSNRPEI